MQEELPLLLVDYAIFLVYILILCGVGYWAGRRAKEDSAGYFLAGHRLPWFIIGTSFIASNISTEHFIGMIGASFIYGIVPAVASWGNVMSFTLMVWLFIPFLLASKVFTTPEYMEKRFSPVLRQFFAIVTVLTNILAFLAAVLYGGALACETIFGWNLWVGIVVLAVVAGVWAIYGGLSSVAWTDFVTVIVMISGGILVTIYGLLAVSGEAGSITEGFAIVMERNRAEEDPWKEAVEMNAQNLARQDEYDRLSVIQPVTHNLVPWPQLLLGVLSVSIWYNVCNQFMIQRVLGARSMWDARMGITLAGFMQVFLPLIIVMPGLILFALDPSPMLQSWSQVQRDADRSYINMIQTLLPAGLRGLFLAAIFGAIQSTVNSVLNSTATIFTLDIYGKLRRKKLTDHQLVQMGMYSSIVILLISILLAGMIPYIAGGLFVYIQTLYAFFAPPFASTFLLGILFRRINAKGAIAGVAVGFLFAISLKLYIQFGANPPGWIHPYSMQAITTWTLCTFICVAVSLLTAPPRPEQVTDQLTFNWTRLNIFAELGTHWYSSVVLWWGIFVAMVVSLYIVFSGAIL